MTKDTGEEETEQEVSADEDESEAPSTEKASSKENDSNIKVPEEFQKEAMALVQSCRTVACLDFLQNEVSEMRQKLMSSQKKNKLNTADFDSEGMPSDY